MLVVDDGYVTSAGPAGTRAAGPARPERWSPIESAVRLLSATIAIGAVAGALIGGVGGRIAMRVLFVTSDDAIKGAISDDGFEIGRFTLGDTIALVIVTTFIGVIAALFFLVAWPFLARLGRATVPATAALYGTVGGAMMVHRDGIDFRLLEPVLLAIALFVGICAGFGAAVAHVVSRAAAPGAWPQTLPRWLIAVPPLAVLFPPFFPVAAAGLAVNLAASYADDNPWWWRLLQAGAYVVMAALFLVGLVDLVRDTAALT
jgi:hypothetical protein